MTRTAATTARTRARILLCAAMAMAMASLAGCAGFWTQSPAPVIRYGAEPGVGSAGAHTAVASDTLWNIANRYHVSMQDLVLTNNLSPPYALRAGQRLRIPPPQTYRLRSGDSLYTVSRLFNVSTTALARLNNLSPPYHVGAGQTLRLPAITPPATRPPATPSSSYAAAVTHNIPDDSASSGAIIAESLPPPPGQGHLESPRPPPAAASSRDLAGMPPQPMPRAPYDRNPYDATPYTQPPTSIPSATVTAAIPQSTAPRTNGRFEWPVIGRILSAYGPRSGGEHNDGINIAGARGTPVRAAEDGTIVYADSELKGFGNLILIRHADRWMTAYAHLDSIVVKKGAKVARGQTIGTLGSTGSVDTPQLHFEVRRGTEALNPEIYLATPRG